MEQLQSQCVQYLSTVEKRGLKALRYLSNAEQYNLTDTVNVCVGEIASVPLVELEGNNEYNDLCDKLKNLVLSFKTRELEERKTKTNQICETLVEFFYQSAGEGYIKFLRDQGLESTVLNTCPFKEKHHVLNKHKGRRTATTASFDPHCASCRKIVTVPKTITLENGQFCSLMEELLETIKPTDDTVDKKNTSILAKLITQTTFVDKT